MSASQSRFQLDEKNWKLANLRGVLAQLVERLNGIEEVRGSNPLGSSLRSQRSAERRLSRGSSCEGGHFTAAFPMRLKNSGVAGQLQKFEAQRKAKICHAGVQRRRA